jgi:signal transduction histidine kinase
MALQASKLVLTGKATLDWLIHLIVTRFKQLKPSQESADYKVWRDQFLWKRLGLCLWVAIPLWCCATVTDLYFRFDFKGLAELPPEMVSVATKALNSSLLHDVAVAPLLLTLLILHRTSLGYRYASVLFLVFSWCATLLQEVFATFHGFALGNNDMWRLAFMAQATLIPVRWGLHLISQLGVLVYYVGVNSALGLPQLEGHPLVSIGWLLMIFWFCVICNLGVYLYERLQRAEFESRRELRVFLHAISHDLRTPLMGNAIVLQNLLKKSDSQVSVSAKVLERLLEGNSRQINLLDSLQEAYNLEVRGVALQCESLQLSTVVTAVLCDMEPLLKQNRVIVENLVQADLPRVNADAVHLGRVLSNLINNALKHNPYGITLTVDAYIKGEKMLCRVQDNGVGMSKQQCRRVFELYTRGEKARFMPGLGIGLYVCRQIITAHGGQMGVTSLVGTGSTFWFTLPLN